MMSSPSKNFSVLKKTFFNTLIIFFTVVLLSAFYINYLSRDLPSLQQLENFDPDEATEILSADGVLLKELYTQRRMRIDLEEIPQFLIDGAIASEDRRFYQHWGISMRDVLRAIIINSIPPPSFRQGFSSITQQLARNLYDSIGFKKTISRKIKEMITAVQIERTYTKDEIIEMYLNSIHFGHGTFGVQVAAKRFFKKDAVDLNLDECALLIGVLPRPATYSPINNPEIALRRRNVVLKLMLDQKFILESQYLEARAMPLDVTPNRDDIGKAPYFTEYVRRLLEIEDEELGLDIYRDGLTIYTTIDSRLQNIAEESVMSVIEDNQNKLNSRLFNDREEFEELAYLGIYPEDSVKIMMKGEKTLYKDLRDKLLVQTAFVAIDPKTGHIKAMIGGRPDYHDQYNRATQAKRQPGSVFKPFVYTSVLDNGYPVTYQLLNQPVVLNIQNSDGKWEKWMPSNYDGSTGGLTTLRDGLKKSMNLISVRMVQELVPAEVVASMAERMNLTTSIRAVDAIALGTSEVYPLEITSAYATYSNNGVWCKPIAINRIVDRFGATIKEYSPRREEVLSEETAYLVTDLLQSVVDNGTGGSARWKYKFTHPAGGKTGTTQNWTDAWFVGFSPKIAAGVWFGVDDPKVSLGVNQSGSRAALPVWAKFMKAAHDSMGWKPEKFTKPDGISTQKICRISKLLPIRNCPVENEIFITKYSPSQKCKVHTDGSSRRDRN